MPKEEENLLNLEYLFDTNPQDLVFQGIEDDEDEDEKPVKPAIVAAAPEDIDILEDEPEDEEVVDEKDEVPETPEFDDEDGGEETTEDDSQKETFSTLGKFFSSKGVLLLGEDEDADKIEWTEEKFIEKFEESASQHAWYKLEQIATEAMGERGMEFLKDVFINKVPYTNYLASFQEEDTIESLDPEKHGEKIVRKYLTNQGLDEEEVEDQIAYFTEHDTLEKKAEKFKAKLVESLIEERKTIADRSRAEEQARADQEKKRNDAYYETLQNAIKEKELNGVPFNAKEAQSLFDFVVKTPHILKSGQKMSDFEYKLATMKYKEPDKFLTIAKLIMNDVDLTAVKRAEVTKETNSLFSELQNKTKKRTAPPTKKTKELDITKFLFKQ